MQIGHTTIQHRDIQPGDQIRRWRLSLKSQTRRWSNQLPTAIKRALKLLLYVRHNQRSIACLAALSQ